VPQSIQGVRLELRNKSIVQLSGLLGFLPGGRTRKARLALTTVEELLADHGKAMRTVAWLSPDPDKGKGIPQILNDEFKMASRLFNRAQIPCHLKLYGRSGKTPNVMQLSPRNEMVWRRCEPRAWDNLNLT